MLFYLLHAQTPMFVGFSISWAAVVGICGIIASVFGFGGMAVGWGMHRQALRDLRDRFIKHELESEKRDSSINMLANIQAGQTEIGKQQQIQIERINDLLYRLLSQRPQNP